MCGIESSWTNTKYDQQAFRESRTFVLRMHQRRKHTQTETTILMFCCVQKSVTVAMRKRYAASKERFWLKNAVCLCATVRGSDRGGTK